MRLRNDIEVVLGASEGTLEDKLFRRRITLGQVSTDIVRHLDGARGAAELTAATGHSREEVDDALRTLLLLNLVEGQAPELVGRARALIAGKEALGRIVLGESRFGCVGSGDCCQSYHFGPLTDEDVARLEKLPIAEAFPHLQAPYIYEREMPGSDKTGRFLRDVENRCLFLLDDCRCGLHAKFGYASKPGLCRYYPFEQFATLDGIQLYDKGGCSQFATTARSGKALVDQLDELMPLMPAQPMVHHPVVLLDASTPIDFAFVQPLLRASVDELERPPAGAPEMLRVWVRRTRALLSSLQSCPLVPEAPGAAVDELLASGLPPFLGAAPPDALAAGAAALVRVARALLEAVTYIINFEHQQSSEFYSGRQSKELLPILHIVEEVASSLADPGFALSDYAREVAAVAVDDPDLDDVLRLSLRNQLFGHGALSDEQVVPAQLRLAMVQLLSLWGARIFALGEGRPRAQATDLSRGHMLATRVPSWTAVRRVFFDEQAQLEALSEVLPELARWRPRSLAGTMT